MIPGLRREYIFIKGSLSGNNSAPIFTMFAGRYCLIEGITLSGSYSWDQVVFVKSDNQYVTIRDCHTTATFDVQYGVMDILGQEQIYRQEEIEVCWCYIDAHGSKYQNSVIVHWHHLVYPLPRRNIYIYRNTLKGRIHAIDNNQTVIVEKNVIVSDTKPEILPSTANRIVQASDNVIGGLADNIIDSNGNLIGNYSAQYLGIRGHEAA